MDILFQLYFLVTVALGIIAGFLIIAYHILIGREEE